MMAEQTSLHSALITPHTRKPGKVLRVLGWAAVWTLLVLINLWAAAAIYVDCRIPVLGTILAVLYLAGVVLLLVKRGRTRALIALVGFCLVLTWWFSLKPSNTQDWRSDVVRQAWTETNGDLITVHNLRDCKN